MSHTKNRLETPMTQMKPMPPVRGIQEANMESGPKGHVNDIAADVVIGPQQGPHCDSSDERQAELNKRQGW